MQIKYCDSCGVRISPEDIESGAAPQDREERCFCPKCAQTLRAQAQASAPAKSAPPTRPNRATTTMSRSNAAPQPKPAAGSQNWIMIGSGGGAVLLIVLYLAFSGGTPEPMAAKKPELEIVKTIIATPTVQNPPVKPVDPEPPARPRTAGEGEIDDIRERYALRKWEELKPQINPTTYASRRELRNFIASNRTTAAGKQAEEFMKTLPAQSPPLPEAKAIVAGFTRDFKPDIPAPGWSYLWNQEQIQFQNKYTPLVWNAKKYGYAAEKETWPSGGVAGWVYLDPYGGHTGKGFDQQVGMDHFGIAAYTIQPGQGGKMAIMGTLTRNDKVDPGTIDLRVYVNGTEKLSKQKISGAPFEFALVLDVLKDGDVVYVGVGPDRSDACDTFSLDFNIYQVP